MSHVPFVPASDQNMERVATALESMAGNPMIAENYDNTSTYAVGEHARHDGLLYKCITPITTAESWNASHWQEVKLADEIEDQNGKIGDTNLPTVAQTLTGAIAEQNNNIAKLREGVAIVVDGDTATIAVPVGGYAYIRNNTHGLTDGLYKNSSSSAFPVSGGTADSTVFTSVPGGAVNDAVHSLNSKITQIKKTVHVTGTTDGDGDFNLGLSSECYPIGFRLENGAGAIYSAQFYTVDTAPWYMKLISDDFGPVRNTAFSGTLYYI